MVATLTATGNEATQNLITIWTYLLDFASFLRLHEVLIWQRYMVACRGSVSLAMSNGWGTCKSHPSSRLRGCPSWGRCTGRQSKSQTAAQAPLCTVHCHEIPPQVEPCTLKAPSEHQTQTSRCRSHCCAKWEATGTRRKAGSTKVKSKAKTQACSDCNPRLSYVMMIWALNAFPISLTIAALNHHHHHHHHHHHDHHHGHQSPVINH